eukprot:124274_1
MTEQYGMTKEEVKKLLELTDNRAVALAPEEFDAFYGSQPKELVTKFMDKNLNEKDRFNDDVFTKQREERRERIEAIKKLERKKRARLTTPIKYGVRAARKSKEEVVSASEQKQLETLKSDQDTMDHNEEIIRSNLMIKQRNEQILDRFFDEE